MAELIYVATGGTVTVPENKVDAYLAKGFKRAEEEKQQRKPRARKAATDTSEVDENTKE